MKSVIVLLTFIAILKSIQALTCNSNIDCKNSPNTICLNGECICKNNYFLQDNKCIALLNTNCVRHSECRVKYSICSPGAKKCRCGYGYYSSNDKKICKRFARYLNDTCVETYGCRKLPFSECSKDKKCVCKKHLVEKFGKCKSSVGGSCKNDFDCGVDNSVCRSGRCQCSNEFIFSN